MMRKIVSALLKPGRRLGLDNPQARRARSRSVRSSLLTIPAALTPTALRVFMALGIAVTMMSIRHTLQDWAPETPITANYGTDFATIMLNKLTGTAPGLIILVLPLIYLASATGGLIMGAFQAGYNLMDRLLGQKAMVEKATEAGKAEGKAEGITIGIAQERERQMQESRNRRRERRMRKNQRNPEA